MHFSIFRSTLTSFLSLVLGKCAKASLFLPNKKMVLVVPIGASERMLLGLSINK